VLSDFEFEIRENGTIRSIRQKEKLTRRVTIGSDWSNPAVKPSSKKTEWLLYGKRLTMGGPTLIWKEGNREVVWSRPVALDTLQGEWVSSVGAKISVEGTEVTLNGIKMKAHPVRLRDDGSVKSIGTIWQMRGWIDDGKIEFKEAPNEESMQYARSVIWTTATPERMQKWTNQMKDLGYAGSAEDPLHRGIEGCVGGTCDAAARAPVEEDVDRDKAEVMLLNTLIMKWQEKELVVVPPAKVIPDCTNRGETGLSLEHAHFIASSFQDRGFQKRNAGGDKGHDIPVLVRESFATETGRRGVTQWKERLGEEEGFADSPLFHTQEGEFFTSLGNGHFFQALNLFRTNVASIYTRNPYKVTNDAELKEAIDVGIPSLVISSDCPLVERGKIAALLNSKREYRWTLSEEGNIQIQDYWEDHAAVSQFEAMSKVLDAVELNCLVRTHLNIHDSGREGR